MSHHNRLTSTDWSLACLKKDAFNCSFKDNRCQCFVSSEAKYHTYSRILKRDGCSILVLPDISWEDLHIVIIYLFDCVYDSRCITLLIYSDLTQNDSLFIRCQSIKKQQALMQRRCKNVSFPLIYLVERIVC